MSMQFNFNSRIKLKVKFCRNVFHLGTYFLLFKEIYIHINSCCHPSTKTMKAMKTTVAMLTRPLTRISDHLFIELCQVNYK